MIAACAGNAAPNAFIELDKGRVLNLAKACDRSPPEDLLHGLPMAIEDAIAETAGGEAPLFSTMVHNTHPGSTAGIPGVTIPVGLTERRLPVGLGLDGPLGSDRRLLAVANALERALPPMPHPAIRQCRVTGELIY